MIEWRRDLGVAFIFGLFILSLSNDSVIASFVMLFMFIALQVEARVRNKKESAKE